MYDLRVELYDLRMLFHKKAVPLHWILKLYVHMMRRIHSIILLFVLLIGGAGSNYVQAAVYSGSCGANATWSLNIQTAILVISGTGAIDDYTNTNQIPWYSYRSSIIGVSISNGITRIGQATFYNCFNLTSVSMGTGVTSIGTSAFYGCSKLPSITIGNHVTTIEQSAFYNCSALKSITIPPSVTSIGTSAFVGCWAMESVYITDLAAWCHINFSSNTSSPFYRNTRSDVAHGGGNLYVNGTKVTTLRIPDGITEIPHRAFFGFMGITSIQFNQVTTIGNHAFAACHGLTSLTFPEGVTAINYNTFGNCSQLQTIYLPASLTTFGDYVWWNCDALTDIYVSWTENIPSLSTSITDKYPQSDITLHVPCGTIPLYKEAMRWWSYTIVDETVASGTCGADGDNLTWNLCNGTLTISGTGAMVHYWSYPDIPWWNYRGSIQRIVIEEGVTTIGNHAFVQCSNLTSVSLPNTLTAISYLAFGHCTSLPSLTIPSSVTSMADMFIHNTQSLTDVYVSWTGDDVPTMPADIHQFDASHKQLHIPCGQAGAYYAKGWNNRFTLPGVVSGTCGDNVRWTFESCNGTLSIFGTGPMADYDYKGTPWYPYRQSITSITIANGVTSIGEWAFHGCTNLTSVTIPSNVTNIGGSAFYYCISLTSITIPNSVINISDFAFYHCTALSSISIPNSVTSIGIMAFDSCTGLTSITIPNSITSIGEYAFYTCSSLTDIYVSWTTAATIPVWYYLTSNDPQSSITLHVPCSAMSLYQAADGWKDYTIEGEGGPYTISVESDDPTMGTVDARKIDN